MDILAGLSQSQVGAIRHIRRHIQLGEGEPLFWEGQPASSLYVVLKGRIEVFKETPKGKVILAHVGEREVLGEVGILMEDSKRSASARALDPTVVLEIPNNPVKLFRQLKDWDATITLIENLFWVIASRLNSLDQRTSKRGSKKDTSWMRGMEYDAEKGLEAIRGALPSKGFFRRMAESFTAGAGSYIFHQGEVSDGFYFIRSGTVQILKEMGRGDAKPLGKMSGPCIVGEVGYFSKQRRTASVRCASEVEYHFFSAERFEELREKHPADALKVIFAAAQLAVFLFLQRETLPEPGRKSPN